MKKKKNTVIQAPVRHTEPKYESHDGVLFPGHRWGIFKWPSGPELKTNMKLRRSDLTAQKKSTVIRWFDLICMGINFDADSFGYLPRTFVHHR